MKGVVFTEFIELVEDNFGLEVIKKIENSLVMIHKSSSAIYHYK
jgi:hypothetical protein|tara:strand:+ start:2610 stop:2741 length:132 start_codon:yes stop_codon:yes gene_type:complete